MNRNWYEPEPGFKDLGLNRTEPNRGLPDIYLSVSKVNSRDLDPDVDSDSHPGPHLDPTDLDLKQPSVAITG